MPQTAELHFNTNIQNTFYADGLEHLTDELRCLDLRIQLQFLRQHNRGHSNPLEQFRGLVLSEEEITGLLVRPVGQFSDEEIDETSDPALLGINRSLAELETEIHERCTLNLQQNTFLPLSSLSSTFNLTSFEEQCLIICLAPDLDAKYEKLYAYLLDDITRKKPTIGLVLELICPTFRHKISARAFFAPQAPLLKYRLMQVTDPAPDGCGGFTSRLLKIDDHIADYLLGSNTLDARLFTVARLLSPEIRLESETVPEDLQAKTRNLVRVYLAETSTDTSRLMLYFRGPGGSGKKSLAAAISHDLGQAIIIADLGRILKSNTPFEEIVWLLGRELALQSATLCLEGIDCLLSDEEQNFSRLDTLLEMLLKFSRVTFFCGTRPWRPQGLKPKQVFIDLEFPVPDVRTRKYLWDRHLKNTPLFADGIDCGALADKFRFTPGQIEDAVITARNRAEWQSSPTEQIHSEDLHAACRSLSNTRLSALARKVKPVYTRQDIVLPSDQLKQLLELCNQAKLRHIVYGEWGFDRKLSLGKGLAALFSGPPGTGKTMAAEVIANELKLDLYRIDLSQVVSKYIGETEKNLDRIFTEAQSSNAILFFDEADALFGKRSEVKDAHDRYANIEIGYLLQKMEEYEGIVILATNMRANMDEAFVRRLQVAIAFPFPDEEHREMIWRSIFPAELPLGPEIDLAFLANKFKITGGNIKNIAITAAFYAAEKQEPVTMQHLIRATSREMQKMGKICTKAELGDYYELLET